MAQLNACDKCTSENGPRRLKLDRPAARRSDQPPSQYYYEHRDWEVRRRRSDARSNSASSEASRVEFIDENGGGPGVRLKKAKINESKPSSSMTHGFAPRSASRGYVSHVLPF